MSCQSNQSADVHATCLSDEKLMCYKYIWDQQSADRMTREYEVLFVR
jgi:hypothetical protein